MPVQIPAALMTDSVTAAEVLLVVAVVQYAALHAAF